MNTIFFGTEKFATIILQSLLDNPLFDISLVITQPDKPIGRKKILTAPPVKLFAEKNNIPIGQPESLKSYKLIPHTYDLAIVAQYGLLIPKHIIETPTYGTINVHTSLLPKYRGASPIQSALLNGDVKTGVTIMQMDEGMDTGPLLSQIEITILPDETYLEIDERMAHIGVTALTEAVSAFVAGKLKPQAQDDTKATLCKKLSRDDGKVDWQKITQEIYNQYRAFTPWPGIWTIWEGKRLKLLKISPSERILKPGVVEIFDNNLFIGTQDRSIAVHSLQLEGKPAMDVKIFVQGYKRIDTVEL